MSDLDLDKTINVIQNELLGLSFEIDRVEYQVNIVISMFDDLKEKTEKLRQHFISFQDMALKNNKKFEGEP